METYQIPTNSIKLFHEFIHTSEIKKPSVDSASIKKELNFTSDFIVGGSGMMTWQKGLQLAKGKYIWIAESDDYSDLNFLESLVPILEKSSSIKIAYCNSNLVNEENLVYGTTRDFFKLHKPGLILEDSTLLNGIEFAESYFTYLNYIPNASSAIFRNEKVNVDASYRRVADWKFWIELSIKGEIFYFNESLNYWRKHPKNVTKADIIQKKEYVRHANDLLEIFIKNNISTNNLLYSLFEFSFREDFEGQIMNYSFSNVFIFLGSNGQSFKILKIKILTLFNFLILKKLK